jgi:hypothetical protein
MLQKPRVLVIPYGNTIKVGRKFDPQKLMIFTKNRSKIYFWMDRESQGDNDSAHPTKIKYPLKGMAQFWRVGNNMGNKHPF